MAKKKKSSGSKAQQAVKSASKPISKKVLLIGLAVLVAAALVVLLLLRIGPINKLKKAAQRTFFAENFTTMFDLTVNGEKVDGIINASINRDERTVDMYMTMETHESNYVCGIYKTDFVVGKEVENSLHSVDITDRLNSFFDLLEKNGKADWQLLLNIADTDLHGQISKDFEFETLLDCIGKWLNQLNSKKWATKNAGYSVSSADGITTYSFKPDPYTLVTQSQPTFRSAFRQKDRYSQLEEYVENAKYLFASGKADFSFQIQHSNLIGANFEIQYNNTHIIGNFSFIGINATTVDIETIAFYIAESKK